MKITKAFAIITTLATILIPGCTISTTPENNDPVQEFVASAQIGIDSGNVSLIRGGLTELGFSLRKSFSSLPNVQLASLTEMRDLTLYVSKVTGDSFYVTICLRNGASMANISKTMKFNWIAFPSPESNGDIFGGYDSIEYNMTRGGSKATVMAFNRNYNPAPLIFSTSRFAISDVQTNLNAIDSASFTVELLYSRNASAQNVQGVYKLQWLALPSGINKSTIETGSSSLEYSLNRGEGVQKTVVLSNLHSSRPCIIFSNQDAVRDMFVNLEEITNTSFKINVCLSNNSSSLNVSGVYHFSWFAVGK